mmetsp:Transcript_112243/g.198871  ORF Transcript_112243/g.198871 Transcript_112243/m.198871 type:complete len:107 (-) Transcript_112243:96-416(-)
MKLWCYLLLATSVGAAGAGNAASAFLSRRGPVGETEAWLAAHLKDHFEIGKEGMLREQSGLNIPWDYEKVKPRNAKNDCGAPGDIEKAVEKQLQQAEAQGKLNAAR